MDKIRVEKLLADLAQIERKGPKIFPYAGCRFVLEGVEDEFEGFIPDLNSWSMDIAGYCSWGAKILWWPQKKLIEAQSRMTLGFFDKHPEYCILQRFISESDSPDLYEYLDTHERMRKKLIEVFSCLLEGNESHST
jgi:hypothetical protein